MTNSRYWFQQVGKRQATKEALAFFGTKTCVLNDSEHSQTCEWHHLDENSKNNPRMGNLVPISGGLNQAIQNARIGGSQQLIRALGTNRMREAAAANWAAGRFKHSYGANRLGSYLEREYRNNSSTSLQFATEALHSLRPVNEQPFAIDTIQRSVLPLVFDDRYCRSLSTESQAALCKEIASWFLDSGDYGKFHSWMALGRRFSAVSLVRVKDITVTRARILQHRGISLYQVGNLTAAQRIISRSDRIVREECYHNGIANNHQYLIRIFLQEFQRSKSKKALQQASDRMKLLEYEYGKIAPCDVWQPRQTQLEFWTGVGLLQIKGEIAYAKKRFNQAEEYFSSVDKLFMTHKVRTMGAHPKLKGLNEYLCNYESSRESLNPFFALPNLHREFYAVTEQLARILNSCVFSERWINLINLSRKRNRK